MIIDIILVLIVIFFILNGLIKGVLENVISIVFIIAYYFGSNGLYKFLLEYLPYETRTYLLNNRLVGYIIIIILGLLLLTVLLFLFKKFIKKSFISVIDRGAGVVVGLIIGYLLICILNSGAAFLNNTLPLLLKGNKEINDSYLLSKEFNEKYNVLNGVLYHGE